MHTGFIISQTKTYTITLKMLHCTHIDFESVILLHQVQQKLNCMIFAEMCTCAVFNIAGKIRNQKGEMYILYGAPYLCIDYELH